MKYEDILKELNGALLSQTEEKIAMAKCHLDFLNELNEQLGQHYNQTKNKST